MATISWNRLAIDWNELVRSRSLTALSVEDSGNWAQVGRFFELLGEVGEMLEGEA